VILVRDEALSDVVLPVWPASEPTAWEVVGLPAPGSTCDGSCSPLCDGCADFEAEEGLP
jgi:hypothetical protein